MPLYPEQQAAVDHAMQQIASGRRATCYASPTGTGKSFMELALLEQLPGWAIITPRVEILRGMIEKLGCDDAWTLSDVAAVTFGASRGIYTPIRLRNMIEHSRLDELPAGLIVDEVHHSTAPTYRDLRLLIDQCPLIGFTATPYRGTPRSTLEFGAFWGEPFWVMTYVHAASRGYIAVPRFSVEPMLDDDLIEVANGEFVISAADREVLTQVDAIADLVASYDLTRPSMLVVSSREQARLVEAACQRRGVSVVVVTGESNAAERSAAFASTLAGQTLLISINVVSEGVDLPLRRLFDFAPTVSPVKWMQVLGRITRPTQPGEDPPEYVCGCRNLERHAYLWEGLVPVQVVAAAQTAFGAVSSRASIRAVGFESFGRFRAVELPLRGGLKASMYSLQTVEGTNVREWVIILHPCVEDLLVASRVRGGGTYGKWKRADEVPTIERGVARSAPAGECTEKQVAWWKRAAGSRGLDPTIEPTRKVFSALPVLLDCGVRMEG